MLYKIRQKSLLLSMMLIVVVLLSSAGCAQSKAPLAATSPSPSVAVSTPTPSAQDIIDHAKSGTAKLTSYQYNVGMSLKMAGTIKNQTQNYNITASGDGANDVTNQKMQMNLNMDLEYPGGGKITLPMVLYLVDGWQYVKVSIPSAGGTQWLKTKMDPQSFAAKDQTGQALEMLKSAVKVNVIGTEDVDGTSCYVLQVDPDLTVLSEWLKSLQGMTNVTGSQPNVDISKFVKNLSIKIDITKDNYILKKSDMTATIALNGADLGSSAQPSDNVTMDMSQTVKMTQINQPVTITLPPEAQNAKDVTGQK